MRTDLAHRGHRLAEVVDGNVRVRAEEHRCPALQHPRPHDLGRGPGLAGARRALNQRQPAACRVLDRGGLRADTFSIQWVILLPFFCAKRPVKPNREGFKTLTWLGFIPRMCIAPEKFCRANIAQQFRLASRSCDRQSQFQLDRNRNFNLQPAGSHVETAATRPAMVRLSKRPVVRASVDGGLQPYISAPTWITWIKSITST